MSDVSGSLRIHPAIGIARVGTSDQYYLGPETMAGVPDSADATRGGGLPIRAGSESEPITSSDLRDPYGALKRQAARFRIFHYPSPEGGESYPRGAGVEVRIGSVIGERRVTDIVWMVHLANKKANSYVLNDNLGIHVYDPAHRAELELRNAAEGPDPDNAVRLRRLTIDPGPRTIRGTDTGSVDLDKTTIATHVRPDGEVAALRDYPKSFPDDSFAGLYEPTGPIDTLGELRTDDEGRLILLSGLGRACGWLQPDGTPFPLIGDAIGPGVYGDVNADGWFDDTGDGPVAAVVILDDASTLAVHGGWAITTDPSYAPQIRNVVTLWDDVRDTWVRELGLSPEVFDSRYQTTYAPSFPDDLAPLFRAVALQRWTTNLPERAISAHDAVGSIGPDDPAEQTILSGLAFIRDPYNTRQSEVGAPFMPLSMGDSGSAFLSVTKTQYFFLQQWNAGCISPDPSPALGPGEQLDRAVLANCLGGRFAPGIEMTFIVRDPAIYDQDWRSSGGGPFRVRGRALDYEQAQASRPFLTVGYVPRHLDPDTLAPRPLEPGDATKFMAVPWHTDYNSCATHNISPNPEASTTLYWSWPAQRPVQVFRAEDVHDGVLGEQYYSVRGPGTLADDLGDIGRWQELLDSVRHWHRIGFVLEAGAIDDPAVADLDPGTHLEVHSQLDGPGITPWPMNSGRSDNYGGSTRQGPS